MSEAPQSDALKKLVTFTICLAILGTLFATAWYFAVDLPSQRMQTPKNDIDSLIAVQGDFSDPGMQGNGQGNQLPLEPAYSERWNEVAEICKGEADIAIQSCQDECKVKHYCSFTPQEVPAVIWPHTDPSSGFCDVFGLLICNGWCDKNVWLPAFQSCLQKNHCEPAPM